MKQKIKEELEEIESPRISTNEIYKPYISQKKKTVIQTEELNFYIPEKWRY